MCKDGIKVVQCKDCDYAFCNHFENGQAVCVCRLWSKAFDTTMIMKQNDFCSYGTETEKEN